MTKSLFQKAVDDLFARLGQTGIYQGREVLFLLCSPDEVVEVGFVKTHTSTHTMMVRICDAPALLVGDSITTDTASYDIMSEPKQDLHGIFWKADVLCN